MKWRNNAPYVLCLSHDVDRIKKQWYHYCFYGLKHPIVQAKTVIEKIKGKEPYWNFEYLTEMEEQYGVRSTFFFLNETHKEVSANFMGRYNIKSNRVTDVIKWLDNKGFEIGLHGSYFSYNNEKLLKSEKDILEQIVGHEIVSTRQHHLNFDRELTWKIHTKIGIKYDSTIGHSDIVGREQAIRTEEGLVEIPITLMDTVNMTDECYEECMSVAKSGGIIMLNFHQCHFNEKEYPENVRLYRKIIEKAKADKAWITDVKTIGEWLDAQL